LFLAFQAFAGIGIHFTDFAAAATNKKFRGSVRLGWRENGTTGITGITGQDYSGPGTGIFR
jgi:hypothetical protein